VIRHCRPPPARPQIIQHLRHYSEPTFQRYIVRIIFMVPVYSLCSFPSLLAEDAAIYITTVRDWCAPARSTQPAARSAHQRCCICISAA
jgi:hypothetical protein